MRSYGYKRDAAGTHKPFRARYGMTLDKTYPAEYLALVDTAPSARDQDGLEACVGYAIAAAAYGKQAQLGLVPIMPSEGFIWWNAKKAAGDEAFNVGTYPSLAVATLTDLGMCPESACRVTKANYGEQPPDLAYTQAYDSRFEVVTQELVDTDPEILRQEIMAAFHELGPVTLGLAVDQKFEDEVTHSVIEAPTGPILGQHYLAGFGYTPVGIWVLNSWSTAWGNNGWGILAWDWVLNSATDIVAFQHVGVIG